jgi:hypothetical protein
MGLIGSTCTALPCRDSSPTPPPPATVRASELKVLVDITGHVIECHLTQATAGDVVAEIRSMVLQVLLVTSADDLAGHILNVLPWRSLSPGRGSASVAARSPRPAPPSPRCSAASST